MSDELNVIPSADRCRHLLYKGLFVNAGLETERAEPEDGNFWCARNQTTYGPDDRLCNARACRNPARRCYEAP